MKLFKKSEHSAVTELRRIVAQNESDETWRTTLFQRAVDLEREYDSARESLTAKPSDGGVKRLIEAARAMADAPALRTAHGATSEPLAQAAIARAVPAVLAALIAIEEALNRKIEEVQEHVRTATSSLGVDLVGDRAFQTLDEVIGESRAFAKRIQDISNPPDPATALPVIQQAVDFVLSHV